MKNMSPLLLTGFGAVARMQLMKKFLLALTLFLPLDSFAQDDPFALFDEGPLITESTPLEMDVAAVTFNAGADGVNVSDFDIAGVLLGMTFDDVHSIFFRNGSLYMPREKNSIVYSIFPDWKNNLDYECRQQKIYQPEKLENCVRTLALSRGLLYASELHLERQETGETIEVFFTSNATDNVVWRVIYRNDVNELPGANPKFEDQRQKKILAFWQEVLDKYGAPNSGNDKWITSGNSYDPMMTAFYGVLDLSDSGLNAADAARNVQQSRENFMAKPYAF